MAWTAHGMIRSILYQKQTDQVLWQAYMGVKSYNREDIAS